MSTYQALSIPPAGRERGGMEVLRSGIVDGELHVTLRPAFNDPQQWGRLLAEVMVQDFHAPNPKPSEPVKMELAAGNVTSASPWTNPLT